MRNYPNIITNLNISTKLNAIAREIKERGYILRGSKDPLVEKFHIIKSDDSIISYSTKEQSYEEYVKEKQIVQLEELERRVLPSVVSDLKFNKFFLIGGSLVTANAILVGAPLFAGAFIYFLGITALDTIKLNSINKQLKQDRWFLDNESQVEKSLQSNTELFKSLSESSQTILTRDGKISLNNIDQFPKNDLRLVRRTISKDNKTKRLNK